MTPPTGPTPSQSPLRSRRALVVFAVSCLLSLAADLWSKHLAFAHIADAPVVVERDAVVAAGPANLFRVLPMHKPVVVVPKVLDLTLVLNPGAVFGIGAGKRWFFVAFTGIAAVACVVMFARGTRPRDTWLHAALGMVLGGGLGNA